MHLVQDTDWTVSWGCNFIQEGPNQLGSEPRALSLSCYEMKVLTASTLGWLLANPLIQSHKCGQTCCFFDCLRLWALTRVDQFESFPGVLCVAVKLQPQVVRGGDQRQSQHGRARERSQHVGCVVFAVINLEIKAAQCTTLERRQAQRTGNDPVLRCAEKLLFFWFVFFFPGRCELTFSMSPWARWNVRAEMLMPFPACTWRKHHEYYCISAL